MATIRALLGLFPKTGDFENKRIKLEEEFKAIMAFRNSKELRAYHELETYINSEEFAQKKKEILALRYQNTEDYRKEKEFISRSRKNDIKAYYKVNGSNQLNTFQETEKSDILKRYLNLEEFIKSAEFAAAKREASLSSKEKFAKSDLAKTYNQYLQQKVNSSIIGYYKFIGDKRYSDYLSVRDSGLLDKIAALEKEVQSAVFQQRKASMKKSEFKNSDEERKINELKNLKKLKTYKNYLSLYGARFRKDYESLHNKPETEAFADLKAFINSKEFKQQKKEIESKKFEDTKEYSQLKEYQQLKKSDSIKAYFKFKESSDYKNYVNLKGSSQLKDFENLKSFIESDEFKKFKAYCLKSPKKRWQESKEFEKLKEYADLKKSEKISWYLKNFEAKKFDWLRTWKETFNEDFSSQKLDSEKWLTKYYWGEKMLKESYSLSQDKHFVTDGKNLHHENGKLQIVTKKEQVTGKSWHPTNGFIPREFGYTSGLISTGLSFNQRYGTFEAKLKIHEAKELINAFWLVGKTMIPHIDVMKAGKKLYFGNAWGEARNLKTVQRYITSLGRSRFSQDYFIYTLEWLPGKITWKINGVEVASTQKGVPEESMYLVLSSGLQKDVSGILPARFEIDWIRCFQINEYLEQTNVQKRKVSVKG